MNITIEQLSDMEEKVGIEIKNISYTIEDEIEYINVFGEVHSIKEKIEGFTVNVVFYDSNNRILAKEDNNFYNTNFLGFDVFKCMFDYSKINSPISRIVVYPALV